MLIGGFNGITKGLVVVEISRYDTFCKPVPALRFTENFKYPDFDYLARICNYLSRLHFVVFLPIILDV